MKLRKSTGLALCLAGCVLLSGFARATTDAPAPLDRGFRLLYDLKFDEAQQQFAGWQKAHAEDPVGPVAEAAGLLFSELNRLGVLEAQFLVDDKAFENRRKLSPDPEIHQRFDAALQRAQNIARARLAKDPKDHDGLFSMTLSSGLQADYAALVEKRNVASLHYSKDGAAWAQQLLAAHPECYDAYVATGISKYVIGSLNAPFRWLLKLGGFNGDKQGGVAELQLAAQRGHYLAPFARLLLAIAYLRDKDINHARQLLIGLRDEFPGNPLYAREISRLDSRGGGTQ